MKIYTKTGDQGQTGLFGGERVAKDSLRVQAYGGLDELNATLGWALTQIADSEVRGIVARIQSDLLVAGADLATPLPSDGEDTPGAVSRVPRVEPGQTRQLEEEIDRFDSELAPLRHFILPGGGPAGAALHVARAVCRRAERAVVALSHAEPINPEALRYVNRLSDHLFTLARLANQREGSPEPIWNPRRRGDQRRNQQEGERT